jgi:hypothetical protein
MQIIGDRHYKCDPGESITFVAGPSSQTAALTAAGSSTSATSLPISLTGGSHQTLVVTAGFTGHDGGNAVVNVTGTTGSDSSKIRQLTAVPFRSAIFILD